jgi:hypothetical protein
VPMLNWKMQVGFDQNIATRSLVFYKRASRTSQCYSRFGAIRILGRKEAASTKGEKQNGLHMETVKKEEQHELKED